MGYYTRYKLSVVDGPADQTCPCSHCGGTGKGLSSISAHIPWPTTGDEPQLWYDHEHDMLAFSKKHPSTTFKLNGVGEEQGDVWVKFFKNGQLQVRKANTILDESVPPEMKNVSRKEMIDES